jgi:hypothetical protein
MTEKPDDRGVAGNAIFVLYHSCRALRDRVAQLAIAIMAMHFPADTIAGINVRFSGWPNEVTANRDTKRAALHARQVFAHIVAEFRI